jgi:D-tyrosyl-tRNA(Tyr) deacylase
MVCVVQRVLHAAVAVAGTEVSRIGPGLLLLVGVGKDDTPGSAARLAELVAKLRVLEDADGRMGRSLLDGGEALAVSQFTLLADFTKGNRPSFHRAMASESARPIFGSFVAELAARLGRPVQTGVFGAEMRVDLANDGPATFTLEA